MSEIVEEECAICYEKMDDTEIQLICGHKYHYNCILN